MTDETTTTIPALYIEPQHPKRAWVLATIGLIAITAAAAFGIYSDGFRPRPEGLTSETDSLAMIRLVLTLGGAFAIGIAISMRPASAPLLTLAFAGALLARFGIHPAWDSARMVAGFAAIVASIAVLFIALPKPARRLGMSLVLLFHFGGIFVAGIHAPEGESAWTQQVAYHFVYRPYLQFIGLNSGYGYFALGPAPEHSTWFCIEYEQGHKRWYKLLEMGDARLDPMGLAMRRRSEMTYYCGSYSTNEPSEYQKTARELRCEGKNGIPFHPSLSRLSQFRPTNEYVHDHALPSLIRHLCKQTEVQHPDGKTCIKSVRVYDVVHRILKPDELETTGFYDPQTYEPYYQGEFDPAGKEVNISDPMRYWLIPIYYESKNRYSPVNANPREIPDDFIFIDGLKRRAGSSPFEP